MKIKAIENFAHTSGRVFIKGLEYEVTDASGAEFVKGGIAATVEEIDLGFEKKKASKQKAE